MFTGSLVALVTPMKKEGAIDYDCLEKLIDFHVEQGSDGLVIAGTTGESATLDYDEHCKLLNRAYEMINQRLPMIAGTGANSTSEAIMLTKCASQAKADAALLVTPYYNKPTQRGLVLHHQAVAEAVAIPQLLYNVPGRTACDMLPETVAELSKVSNIIGIKEATGDLQRLKEIKKRVADDFILLSGDDLTTREFILSGGVGSISVTANVAPKLMSEMCRLARAGDVEQSNLVDQKLVQLHKNLFVEANPIPVKWAVAEMGLIGPDMRLPMTNLDPQFYDVVRQSLTSAGVL